MSAAYQLSKMVIPGTDVELDMVTYVDGDGTGRTRCLECESEFEHLDDATRGFAFFRHVDLYHGGVRGK